MIAKLIALWGYQVPVLELLGTTSLSVVVAAALFGGFGLAGSVLVHAAWTFGRLGSPSYSLFSSGVYALGGLLVYLTFRHVRGIGRSFPEPLSVVWYGAASGVGSLVSAGLLSLVYGDPTFWQSAALWSRSTVVTVWVFGPALLIAGKRLPGPWVVPIAGEAERRDGTGRSGYTLREAGPDEEVDVARLPPPARGESLLLGGGLLLAVALTCLGVSRLAPGANHWLGVLYLIPIYWATRRHQLLGGLVAAAGTGAALIAVEALDHVWAGVGESIDRQLEIYVYLLVFLLVGILLGHARERETRLLGALRGSNRRLRKDLDRVVRALTGAVEAKDLYTEGHLHRVSAYALEVGRRLGLTGDALEHLRIASALHDVGKIGVPEQILNKPGPLDPDERSVIERHPEVGARILDAVEGLEAASPLVLHHQERWDGRRDGPYPGYPEGLAGEGIPLGARIIAVVDAFDAMTTNRAYRRGLSVVEAVAELRSERGRQFDPRVVDVFLG
ncbi:MAG: HD domain-containing protein, partial [Acidobacteriota bacterium]